MATVELRVTPRPVLLPSLLELDRACNCGRSLEGADGLTCRAHGPQHTVVVIAQFPTGAFASPLGTTEEGEQ